MKYFYCLIISIAFMVTGCSYIKDYDKPHLELTGQNPYSLSISKFIWGYGTTEINKFNGDFEKLDEKVYEKLKGKQGTCKIFIESITKDKYGKEIGKFDYVGNIDLAELNKYADQEYWHKASGIKSLLYKKFIEKPSLTFGIDSAVMTPATADTVSGTINETNETIHTDNQAKKVYRFTFEELYPLQEDRNLDEQRRSINGSIVDANFTNGVLVIKDSAGEQVIVQFYPTNASSYTYNQLRIAIKAGNLLNGVVARAGASTVDLVSAEITEM